MSHTSKPTVQYVTSFYKVDSFATTEMLFANFRPFLNAKFKIIVFTDDKDFPPEFADHPNMSVFFLPRENLRAFKFENPALPEYRNKEKDSKEFLSLMNAKPELLMLASKLVQADAYVWFDLGILKVSKFHERFVERMGRFPESVALYPNKILFPSCYGRDKVNFGNMYTFPIWRFCGGILIIPAPLVDEFYELHTQQLEKCKSMNALTWEVNLFAGCEVEKPDLFHGYFADHNDSMVDSPLPPSEKRVMLMTMIKNETRIIKRLIESTLPIVDAVCVCDTGSTDNTVEVLTEYFKDFKIPAKVFNGPEHIFKNFGYNRSQSFLAAVAYCKELGWDPENTYALALDADMQLVVQPGFKKAELTSAGYKMIQKSGHLEYYNSRFMKLGHPWSCVGVTHEYWDGANTDTLTMDKIYISDVGDGGCKADKFERDVRLLEEGLKESPNNPRYLFYLAQSYKDSNNHDKAIEYYKRRVDAGGWYEEIWYAMYMLMKLYAEKKDWAQMEMWGMKAYEYRKERSENLLYLVRFFKDRRQYFKAWHYWQLGSVIKKPDDLLFIETDCYDRGFDFERTIIHDYVFPHKKQESVTQAIDYFNKWGEHSCYMNLQWFVQKVPCEVRTLPFKQMGDYVPTSTSMLPLEHGKIRLNVRYVNYRIQPNGSYLMMDNGNLSGDNPVRTRNYTCLMDETYTVKSGLKRMEPAFAPLHNTHIKGLEDLRIFYDAKGALRFFGTTMEYSHNGKIQQVTGDYNVAAGRLENLKHLKAPQDTDCEKNWISYKGDRVIYGWNPFRICRPDSEGRLQIEVLQETPKIMSHMRGSTNLVEDSGFFYGITHCVMYTTPRKYYHMVVKIDGETDRIVGYTNPFFFCNNAIEYTLGFNKQEDIYTAIVSQNDCNPVLVQFKDADLVWRVV
jgi:glycosyltransferase involved in cell wall biosynthesis